MNRAIVTGWSGKALVAALSLALLATTSTLPVSWAQSTANLLGGILDPSGKPAGGFRVVFKDVVSGKEYTSPVANAQGEYSLQVPAGSRYQLIAAVAPDGTRLPVQQIAPLPVRVPGSYRLDVQFQQAAPAVAAATPPPAPTPAPAAAAKPAKPATTTAAAEKKPWWKKPGPWVGIVLGAGAIAAAAGGGSSSKSSTSPSAP